MLPYELCANLQIALYTLYLALIPANLINFGRINQALNFCPLNIM